MIWQVSDGKPGHERQTLGLSNALTSIHKKKEIKLHKLNGGLFKSLRRIYLEKIIVEGRPNFIIGAGHKTHFVLLILGKLFGAKTICIMKPTLPISLFDLCIIPKHDEKTGFNVIQTQGPLNPHKIKNNKKNGGLILVGGSSKHFYFTEQNVFQSIIKIIKNSPSIDWSVASSRRSSSKMKKLLSELSSNSVKFFDNETTSSELIDEKLQQAEYVWITCDSLAMIYESLTVGAKVGIIKLPPKTNSKLVKHVQKLIKETDLKPKKVKDSVLLQYQICESEIVANKIKTIFPDEFEK